MLFGPKKRLGANEKDILEHLTAGDVLMSILCSGRSTRRMYKLARERALERYRTKKTVDSLVDRGWIRKKGENLSITSSGRKVLDTTIKTVRASLHERRWDGRWRIVIFDIPKTLHPLRYKIRSILKLAGFKQLQQSVWIFPHECHELSELIRQDKRLKKHVLYAVVDQLDDTSRVRRLFSI